MSAVDKDGRELQFGDEVTSVYYGSGVLIGIMKYAGKSHDVICIASVRSTGMPLNSVHVRYSGRRDRDLAERKRKAYEKMMPDAFLPRLIDCIPDAEAGDADCIPEV